MQAMVPALLKRSILVVDDSAVQRQHAVALCRALGIAAVHEAADGLQALAAIEALDVMPGLLIVDLEMPRMDGIELIEELHRRGVHVPIALVSSREHPLIESVQALGHSVVAGVRKPLTHENLVNAVNAGSAFLATVPSRSRLLRLPITVAMLRQAIAERAIVPHFQPKVDTQSCALKGVEALARWSHPTLGMVPPDEFIPIAESTGLIHALTLSIMEQAFAQCAAWNEQGLVLSVAINLSPRLLVHPEIVMQICELQRRYRLRAEQVILEVTESSLVDATGSAPGVLARLRLKGFGLSIDDYGTGFSSLQQLTRIPFTELKIDRAFVCGAHRRKSIRTILESAVELAHRLQLATVAEGVDAVDDWRLLQSFGCTQGQGWLIAPAMTGPDLQAWAATSQEHLAPLQALAHPSSP
jgi:EAL domain-containing protein (putative c-di-GMP-specific phosphodiesterase class I)/ActR/RegA family two-component response regulator